MGLADIINIEREYKGIKYEIKGRIQYKVPYGSFITIDNKKIYLSDSLLKLYKKYPLNHLRVNYILGHKIRPCTTKVIVEEVDRECKHITLRYVVNINEDDNFLKVEIYNSYHRGDAYIVEKIILEVIDYIKKLQNKKKGEITNNGYNEYNI
mgnify:CR=1 FL=1